MEQIKNKLSEILLIEDITKRKVGLAAILTEVLKKYDIKPVVVGGSAVELWSMGAYKSQDIDFVAEGISDCGFVLRELGFENEGGFGHIPKTQKLL